MANTGSNLKFVKIIIPKPLKRWIKKTFRSLSESFLYFLQKKGIRNGKFKHIVFVCQGNVCRSVFAEFYLRSKIQNSSFQVQSCGLDVKKSGSSPETAIHVSNEFGIDLSSHLAKSHTAYDFTQSDLIVAMEYPQFIALKKLYPEHQNKMYLMKDFTLSFDAYLCNIYDPYGRNDAEFRRCFKIIKKCIDNLVIQLQ